MNHFRILKITFVEHTELFLVQVVSLLRHPFVLGIKYAQLLGCKHMYVHRDKPFSGNNNQVLTFHG